jgi:hypothetical protein
MLPAFAVDNSHTNIYIYNYIYIYKTIYVYINYMYVHVIIPMPMCPLWPTSDTENPRGFTVPLPQ